LRKDVSAVEQLEATDDTESCSPEGDPDETPSRRQIERQERESAACEKRVHTEYAIYQQVWKALNSAWLPSIYNAISRGDRVAEVIMRRCETTSALDRTGIESTCDRSEPRRAIARQRLIKIGFVPAFDSSNEVLPDQGPKARFNQKELNQAMVLDRIRGGALGFDYPFVEVGPSGIANDRYQLEKFRRWALMEAITQDAPRAFTFSPGWRESGAATVSFHDLRLNRKPLTPGVLTWGPALYGPSDSPDTSRRYWRSGPTLVRLEGIGSRSTSVAVAGVGVADFEDGRKAVLAQIQSSINR
jgi:hypothetical protein